MATDEEIESRRTGDRIYSEPDADPYESELESVLDAHDYITLGNTNVSIADNFSTARR